MQILKLGYVIYDNIIDVCMWHKNISPIMIVSVRIQCQCREFARLMVAFLFDSLQRELANGFVIWSKSNG